MKTRLTLLVLSLLAASLVLAACGAAATQAPTYGVAEAPAATEAPAFEFGQPLASDQARAGEVAVEPALGAPAVPLPTNAVIDVGEPPQDAVPAGAGHMIIKNADVRLLVADPDVAIDRTTQIVGDLGGYIISSRAWYQDFYGENLKYATMTIGVPVDQFERALSRLRDLAVQVLDETASGEDVTDQYVDLQSQLLNLEATRERIKTFLDQATNVDEALRINQQLSEIERQIEEIKGRMNYLSDRSAYSTITVNFEPEFPKLTPTPTATATATPTPRPWKPGDTFGNAKRTVTYAYQGIADFLIWLIVVLIPILAPPALLIWGLWKFLSRKPK